jgi:hypothetical protein
MRSFPSVDSGRQQTRASLGLAFGDRFGALRGGSRSFKARVERAQKLVRLQGKRATKRLSQVIAAGRILHGKEAVGGSSPPEGFKRKEIPVNRGFLLSDSAPQSTSVLPSRPLSSSPRYSRVPAIGLLPRTTEHLPETEGLRLAGRDRVIKRPSGAWGWVLGTGSGISRAAQGPSKEWCCTA